jgi:hypothetical protein
MRRFLVLAMAATLAACNNDVTAPSSGTIVGTYALRSVNGIPLPYTFSNGATLSQDVLTLNNDGSFQDISTFTNGQTSTETGFYTNINGAVQFTDNAGFSFQGSVSGDVLTELVSGYTQAFQRQ